MCCVLLAAGATAQDKSDESDLSLGIQGGVGYMTTTGTISDTFGGGACFTGGLTADYKRLRLKADFAYCQPNLKNHNIFNIKDREGRDAQINSDANATQTMLGVQLGYKVFQNKRFSVTPAAGLFFTHYGWSLQDIEWDKDDKGEEFFKVKDLKPYKFNNASWMASIDIDIKLGEKKTLEPFFLNNRYSRLSTYLRITPWVAGARFNKIDPAIKGLYTGVTVRATGFMQSLGF